MDFKFQINENFYVHLTNFGVKLAAQRKNGDHQEMTVSFNGWVSLISNLLSVKEYLTTGLAKINQWKANKKPENFEPLVCETLKIDDNIGLFLSMYKNTKPQENQQPDWFVVASLRAFFIKDCAMIPLKKPSILLSLKDIDQLLLINSKIFFQLNKERQSHIHDNNTMSCDICSFIDNGVVIFQQINCNNPKEDILKEFQDVVHQFTKIDTPGSCVVMLHRGEKRKAEGEDTSSQQDIEEEKTEKQVEKKRKKKSDAPSTSQVL